LCKIYKMTKKEKTKYAWPTILLLTALLIVAPALSWYYLQKGATYRIASLQELKQNRGKADSTFSCSPVNWGKLDADSLVGKIIIVNIIKYKGQLTEKQTIVTKKLHGQFGERSDIYFLSLLEGADSLQASEYYKSQNVKRNKTYFVVAGNNADKQNWIKTFKFEQNGDFSATECPLYAYVDVGGIIRNYYDVNDENRIKKMVEHIAMKVFDKKENPRLTRELEK
jgi:hypothetical protein